jgi:cell division protein FtsN
MNRRTAMLTAGGLVLAMVVAGVALAMGITGPSQAAANVSEGRHARSPIVRTVNRTETVHRQAKSSGSSSGFVTTAPTSGSSSMEDDATESQQEAVQEFEQETDPAEQELGDD